MSSVLPVYLLASLAGKVIPTREDLERIMNCVGIDSSTKRAEIDLLLHELQGKDLEELIEIGTRKMNNMGVSIGTSSEDGIYSLPFSLSSTLYSPVLNSATSVRYGLVTSNLTLLQLESTQIQASIYDFCAGVTVKQSYVNHTQSAAEILYIFPLDENSTITEFTANLDGKLIRGEVKPKFVARDEYKQAVKKGQTAVLFEQKRMNIFECKIGNLSAGSRCELTISYATTLDLEGDRMRFNLPLNYVPYYDSIRGDPRDENIQQGNIQKSGKLSVNIHFFMPNKIIKVECPTHDAEFKYNENSETSGKMSIIDPYLVKGLKSASMYLLIEQELWHKPRILLQHDELTNSTALQLAICPEEIQSLEQTELPIELIFLIDRSGSMEGDSIEAVQKTMQLLLRSMPMDSTFNIIGFGDRYQKLFINSTPYTEHSLHTATLHVNDHLAADLGGTEMYRPFEHIFKDCPLDLKRPRHIILLTDGQVMDTNAVISLIRKHSQQMRLFTFGIGADVDRNLVKQLAIAGNGQYEFVMNSGNEIQEKVIRQLGRILQPCINNLQINWNSLNDKITNLNPSHAFLQAPLTPHAIFPLDRALIYALNLSIPSSIIQRLKNDEKLSREEALIEIELNGYTNWPGLNGKYEHKLVINLNEMSFGSIISKMAAKKRIEELQNCETITTPIRQQIQQLALKYQIASPETSFLIVYPNQIQSILSAGGEGYNNAEAAAAAYAGQEKEEEAESENDMGFSLFDDYDGPSAIPSASIAPVSSIPRNNTDNGSDKATVDVDYVLDLFNEPESKEQAEAKKADNSINLETVFNELIRLQMFSGAWNCDEKLLQIANSLFNTTITQTTLTSLSSKYSINDLSIVSSILALFLLENCYSSRQTEWQFVAMKCSAYLLKQKQISNDAKQNISNEFKAILLK